MNETEVVDNKTGEVLTTATLDKEDLLLCENMLLKEQLEELRHKYRMNELKREREGVHDHFVSKYEIDTDNYTFSVKNNKIVISYL